MGYYDVYKARLNRNGSNHAERLGHGRAVNFDRFLMQSPHYERFMYKDQEVECVFEPSTQRQDRVVMHVLCKADQEFKPGDICTIADGRYMFWYWDERHDSGYNRWTVLKMSQPIEWRNEDGQEYTSEAYICGPMDKIKNSLKSGSSATLYFENDNLDLMIMPVSENIEIGSYLGIEAAGIKKYYRVVGYNHISTPGVMYVSINQTIEKDLTPAPEKKEEDDSADFFWLGGID